MLPIVKNVPIPKTTRKVVTVVSRKYPFHDMDIGDMFFVPNKTKNSLATHASTVSKKLGKKFVTRLTYMVPTENGWEPADEGDEGAVQGIGCWCVEPTATQVAEAA